MSQEFKTIIYPALCACFGMNPSSAAASVLIREAYLEPENAPRPPRNADVVYYSIAPDPAVQELSAAFFPGLLDLSVGESPAVRRKPAPDTVLTAASRMGLAIDQCVYVGDSEVDLQTSRNVGMDCISVTWGFRDEDQLVSAGATVLVRSPEELRELLLSE